MQPDYFQILDIPILAGRGFDHHTAEQDTVVLSESAARLLWPAGDAIGHALSLDVSDEFHVEGEIVPERHSYQIVGIARDTRGVLLDGSDSDKAYLTLPPDQLDQTPLLLRTRTDPAPFVVAVAAAIHGVNSNVIAHAITLEDALSGSPKFVVARCSGLFASIIGLLGLLLASAGIYGSVSYAVVRRTREVGIRVALGANKGHIFRLILSETARPVMAGLLVGLMAAAAAAQLLRAVLSHVSPLDPLAFIGISIFFFGIALLAAFFPARRALQIDPMEALRCE